MKRQNLNVENVINMNIIEFFIYSFCAFVPLVAIWAAFMVWSGRWKIQTLETDEEIDEFMSSSFFLNKQAE